MSYISSAIANMFNGVSQQPATLRHPSQCEAQENAFSDIATGVRKRAPTQHIAKLNAVDHTNSLVHTINRDTVERYTVIIQNGDLFVYDFTGAAMTVNFPDGKGYLACATPRTDMVVMTVADYSFIVNRTITTALTAAVAPGVIFGTKQKFSDLPAPTGTGNIYKIAGDPSNNFDDYYVKDTAPTNVYVETLLPGSTFEFNASTMPHQLTRTGPGVFTFAKATWNNNLVGDSDSNPVPSFIGQKIRDIFFYRNRLGVVSNEAFILSRTAKYFNYWVETITAALDTDPIDGDASHNKVSILNWAVPFSKALLLFSEQTQFQISGGDALTQRTAKADPVTEFESSTICRPIGLGQDVFFIQPRGDHSGLLEYYVEQETISNDAGDTTSHVPNYVPKDVFKMAGCAVSDTVMLLTLSERNAVYVYKYYWGENNQKLQSSWSKFTFDAADVILNVDFIGTIAYFTIKRADGTYFEKMDIRANATDTGFTFQFLLDRRVELTGVYDPVNLWTTWTLPYPDSAEFQVALGAAFGSSRGVLLSVTRPSSTTIRAVGNYSAGTSFIGRRYTQRYRFSTLYYRDEKGAIQAGRLQIARMFIAYDKSGYFRIEVTPKAREKNTYLFTGKVLGDATLILGSPTIHTGVFKFPVQCRNEDVIIELVNDSALPATVQSAEWEGVFVMHSQRVR